VWGDGTRREGWDQFSEFLFCAMGPSRARIEIALESDRRRYAQKQSTLGPRRGPTVARLDHRASPRSIKVGTAKGLSSILSMNWVPRTAEFLSRKREREAEKLVGAERQVEQFDGPGRAGLNPAWRKGPVFNNLHDDPVQIEVDPPPTRTRKFCHGPAKYIIMCRLLDFWCDRHQALPPSVNALGASQTLHQQRRTDLQIASDSPF
jgi:hypothetical protein